MPVMKVMDRSVAGMYLLLFSAVMGTRAAEVGVKLLNPPATGTVAFALFDSPNTFGDLRDPVLVAEFPLDGRDIYRIEEVPPGEYALLAYYDGNRNGRIDKNFIGIPKEPLGFSNNYRPKGPPSYTRAAFTLPEDGIQHFDMELYQALGKRGRLGAGVGLIGRSSPYRDYDGGVYQVIPAITYTGNRLQWFGPRIQYGLIGSGKLRLAATGEYRMGVYEEDESDYLDGMGDAESTLMAGLALEAELPAGINLSIGGSRDALNRIGGSESSISASKSFLFGSLRIAPNLAVNWMDSDMAANDFGVPDKKATPDRPAYSPGSSTSLEGGLSLFFELTPNWLVIANAAVEWFDDNAYDSPIVDEHYVIKGFGAINYVF
jgi:outer membrane protein